MTRKLCAGAAIAYVSRNAIAVVALLPWLIPAVNAQWNPTQGSWGKSNPGHVRVMTWNVKDGICSSNPKTQGVNNWTGIARIIAAFMTGFGAFGYLLTLVPATKNPAISAPLAALGALAFASVIVSGLRLVFRKTQSSSESTVASVVGMTATLGTGIPENGVGEIVYVQGGTRYTAPARSEDGKPIATGAAVIVTRIAGTQFFVKPA